MLRWILILILSLLCACAQGNTEVTIHVQNGAWYKVCNVVAFSQYGDSFRIVTDDEITTTYIGDLYVYQHTDNPCIEVSLRDTTSQRTAPIQSY